jgi:hypothetical protein
MIGVEMLKIQGTKEGEVLSLRLKGSLVEETLHVSDLPLAEFNELRVNCRELMRINSYGTRAWMRFFAALREKGKHVVFSECSTAVVQQFNLICNFSCGADVESIYVPYLCTSCKTEMVGLHQTRELRTKGFSMKPVKCPKCTGFAVFDDREDEYFDFLRRERATVLL